MGAKIEISGDTAVNIADGGSVEIRLNDLALTARAEQESNATAIELVDLRPEEETNDDPMVAINGGQSIWLVPLSQVPGHWRTKTRSLALPDLPGIPAVAEA